MPKSSEIVHGKGTRALAREANLKFLNAKKEEVIKMIPRLDPRVQDPSTLHYILSRIEEDIADLTGGPRPLPPLEPGAENSSSPYAARIKQAVEATQQDGKGVHLMGKEYKVKFIACRVAVDAHKLNSQRQAQGTLEHAKADLAQNLANHIMDTIPYKMDEDFSTAQIYIGISLPLLIELKGE